MRSQSLFNFFTKAATQVPQEVEPVKPAEAPQPDVGSERSVQVPSAEAAPSPERRLVRRDRNGRVAPKPTIFRGGYAVNPNDDSVDWLAQGDGSINVRGTKFTEDQYRAYNNVRSSLATAMRQREGLGDTEAKARANRLADQWVADRVNVARGGAADNGWQHVDEPAQATPAPAPQQRDQISDAVQSPLTLSPVSQPSIGENYASAVQNPITSSQLFNDVGPIPLTLRGNPLLKIKTTAGQDSTLQQQPAPAPAAKGQQAGTTPTPAPATTPAPTPSPASDPTPDTEIIEAPAWDFKTRALENRNKVADGLVRANGYEGIYYKPGDMSGTLYKSNGEPWRNSSGQVVDAGVLRSDTNWFGASGNDIKHNIEQRYQADANRAFTAEEAAALGFKPVPGAPGYYINSKGEIVDEFGNAEEQGTLVSDVEPSVWNDIRKAWREWSPDPLGLFWSGSREDYK